MKTMWAVCMALPVYFPEHYDQNRSGNARTDHNHSVVANPPVEIMNSPIQSADVTSQTTPPMSRYSRDRSGQRYCHCNSILQSHPSISEFHAISRLSELRSMNQRRHSFDSGSFLPDNHVARFQRLSLPEAAISSEQINRLQRQYENTINGNSFNARRTLSLPSTSNLFGGRSNCFCERLMIPQSHHRADHSHFDDTPWANILGALLVKFIREELQASYHEIPWCLNEFVPENKDFALLFRCTAILAKKFSRTAHRRQIESLALNVNIWSLTNDSYLNILESLCPPERVTADRLILLFFFCSDILLRSLHQNNENFCYLMEWSKQYLNGLNPACILKSLGNQRNKPLRFAVTSACIVGAFACLLMVICNTEFHWRK